MWKWSGNSDLENELVDTVEEQENRMNGESSTDINAPPYVKQIAGEKLLYNTGTQTGPLS